MAQKIGKDGKSQQQRAALRICMSCEWIYKGIDGCPKCQMPSYGARFVYGDRAYKYAKSQKPWFDRKMAEYAGKLYEEMEM
jgi:hypothetical protein